MGQPSDGYAVAVEDGEARAGLKCFGLVDGRDVRLKTFGTYLPSW